MNGTSRVNGLILLALCAAVAVLPQIAAFAADTTPPTGTVVINDNRSVTNSVNVTLKLTWSDGDGSGVGFMRFSNDGATWSAWEPPVSPLAYTLPGGDGYKTVRVQFRDNANNRSTTYSDYIRLDTTPPTGSILINGGLANTASLTVTLGMTWADGTGSGITRMRFSDDGAHWTAWGTPKPFVYHTMPSGAGYHTVRVQFMDGGGNYSTVANDYIKYVPPTEETITLPGGVPLVMVWIPGGSFNMGSPDEEAGRSSDEGPVHPVKVGGFWMAKQELTKRQWQAVMGTTPWAGQPFVSSDPDSPAVFVSWNDAQSFIAIANNYTDKEFYLPSEAQWEFACRGTGTPATRFYWGDDTALTAMGNYAWYWGNCLSEAYAHLAGKRTPNSFGLYDMSGNAWEWVADWYHGDYAGAPTDGSAWLSPSGQYRVLRGGNWSYTGTDCRSAARYGQDPTASDFTTGFRLAK